MYLESNSIHPVKINSSKVNTLKHRAAMLAKVRSFFADRSILEVDTPILSLAATIDLHLEVMTVTCNGERTGFLHTSPEYAMKRLLAEGIGDIYQLSHVFREGEIGRYHNPEFTMLEWYRTSISFEKMIQETIELLGLFVDTSQVTKYNYADAFKHFTGVDYRTANIEELKGIVREAGLPEPYDPSSSWDKEAYLHFIMAFFIEPRLTGLNIIYDFPSSQAALAKIEMGDRGEGVAKRFECYVDGVEVANGFEELTDPIEQRNRFEQTNLERQKNGKKILPLDENFLASLEKGLPESCGVAVGFDRILMLQMKSDSIAEVLPLPWGVI